jgi:hypothetical protein
MNRSVSSKSLALGGILTALTVLSVFFADIMPANTLSLYALSSFFVAIVLIETGVKVSWIFYFATSLLSFIIVPDKTMITPFISFFGVYGIIKHYLEKYTKKVVEYILKYLFFNANVVLAYFLIRVLFETRTLFKGAPLWVVFAALQVIFLVYDYIYTLFIQYYMSRIRKSLKIK